MEHINNTDNTDDMDDDILVLVDEEGEEAEFEFLDTIEMNGREYAVLLPMDFPEGQEADEVVILKFDKDENGEDSFLSVDDEKELNLVFEEFKRKMQEQFDFES